MWLLTCITRTREGPQFVATHLYDKGGSPGDNLRRDLGQRTVLDAHDLQIGAERQLERKVVQAGVVVDVQRLQLTQSSCDRKRPFDTRSSGLVYMYENKLQF